MNLIAWIILGLIAGAIARLLPRRHPDSSISTILAGILGACFGGSFYCFLATGSLYLATTSLYLGGLLFALIGAWIALFIQYFIFRSPSVSSNFENSVSTKHPATNTMKPTRSREPVRRAQIANDTLGRERLNPPVLSKGSIFISYRRSDSIAATGRIYDYLERHFGYDRIFKDIDSIPPGVDFRAHLSQAVAQCQVLIAVIGTTWINTRDENGYRRLDNPGDFVRLEIEAALKRNILVIPVLLSGTRIPLADELPEGLKELAYRNAIYVKDDPDFRSDVKRLIRKIEEFFESDT